MLRSLISLASLALASAGDEIYAIPPAGPYMRCAGQDATTLPWRNTSQIGTIFTTRMPRLVTPPSEGGTDREAFKANMKSRGITFVMPLVEDGDEAHADPKTTLPDVLALYAEIGLTVARCPIKDFTAPPAATHVKCTQQLIDQLLAGKNVLIHCMGGTGRTGLMAISAVKALGATTDPKTYARTMGKPSYVETPAQALAIDALPLVPPSALPHEAMRDMVVRNLVCPDAINDPPEYPDMDRPYLLAYSSALNGYSSLFATLSGGATTLAFQAVEALWKETGPQGPLPMRMLTTWAVAMAKHPSQVPCDMDCVNTDSITRSGLMETLFGAKAEPASKVDAPTIAAIVVGSVGCALAVGACVVALVWGNGRMPWQKLEEKKPSESTPLARP